MTSEILFEDRDIIVIHKKAGVAVQTAQVGQPDMVSELKKYLVSQGGQPYVGVVHRLDQPVEGVLVFGKTKAATAALSAQLSGFCKEYLAVICGKMPAEEGWQLLSDSLVKSGRRAVSADELPSAKGALPEKKKEGKEARLTYRTEQLITLPEGSLCLLQIRLMTGRFHQIREQLSHAGCPILGDRKYGDEKSLAIYRALREKKTAEGLSLCAHRLELEHPRTHERLCFCVSPTEAAFMLFQQL